MNRFTKKPNESKIYCEKCNVVFKSREQYETHLDEHSSNIACESCPLDTILQKITALFKKH